MKSFGDHRTVFRKIQLLTFIAVVSVLSVGQANGQMDIAVNGRLVDVYVDSNDAEVVKIAADLLADDIKRVTGVRPQVKHDVTELGKQAILIGTLGRSSVIDRVAESGKVDVGRIQNQWETCGTQVIANPINGVEQGLVIVGSDRRGTAYGVMDICREIGVSPWYWWGDIPVQKRKSLSVDFSELSIESPSVQYRGIFINDESFGLLPWAEKTFAPDEMCMGPKAYEKVFELMLRTKLNYLWPAMWHAGDYLKQPFGLVPGNVEMADKWAIVMGASHCEPMLRNNVYMPEKFKPWDYATNRTGVLAYWEEAAKDRGKYEAVWTIGMRGISDAPLSNENNIQSQLDVLRQVIADQRTLLDKYAKPHWKEVSQCFVPYNDTLGLYNAGLQVPDDVIIVWVDENYGNIRRLPNAEERERSGGHGVYYHVDYHGNPEKYTWFNTTAPARVWMEMRKAWDNGAKRLWIVNIGDIKASEINMDHWAKFAWNVDEFDANSQTKYLNELACEWFGPEHADGITTIWNEFFRLCFVRRPEHLYLAEWLNDLSPSFRKQIFGEYTLLLERLEDNRKTIPVDLQDAYYQNVYYPVKMLCVSGLATIHQGRALRSADAVVSSRESAEAKKWLAAIADETKFFNDEIAGGKWRHYIHVGQNRHELCKHQPGGVAKQYRTFGSILPDGEEPILVKRWDASEFKIKKDSGNAIWQVVDGLGWSAKAVASFPMTEENQWDPDQLTEEVPHLEYEINLDKVDGNAALLVHVLPSFRLNLNTDLRLAVSINGDKPVIKRVPGCIASNGTDHRSLDQNGPIRRKAVRDNRMTVRFPIPGIKEGANTLRIWTPDPAVVLDQFELQVEKPLKPLISISASDASELHECRLHEKTQTIGWIENGSSIAFVIEDLPEAATKLEVTAGVAPGKGGVAHIRLDSRSGKQVGVMDFRSTGGWDKFGTFVCNIEPIKGNHTLYFVFEGGPVCSFKSFSLLK